MDVQPPANPFGAGQAAPGAGSDPGSPGPGGFESAMREAAAAPLRPCRIQGGAEEGAPLEEADPSMVARLVNSLDPALLASLPQADRNAMATSLAQHRGDPSRPDRAQLEQAYDALIAAGAVPEVAGESADDRLRRSYGAMLAQQLGGTGLHARISSWRVTTEPDWRPSPAFAAATRGADGQGFATAREAILAGAGRAAQEQNRPTQPFGVKAEHGCLVAQAPDGRFHNFFVRGNHKAATEVRRLRAQRAPAEQVEAALDAYRLSAAAGPLAGRLEERGYRIAGLAHTHPCSTGPGDRSEGTNELPSSLDHRSAARRNGGGRYAGIPEAVVFKDPRGRLAVTFFDTHLAGNRLDIGIHAIQTAERPAADAGTGSA